MINHQYKCIFIEVPKTGSTSIRSIIGTPKKPHLNIKEIKEEFFYEKENINNSFFPFFKKIAIEKKWRQYFKFGFVRNPWDRVVSLYLRKEGIQMSDKMSFEEFIHWIENSSDTSIHPSQHKNQLDWFLNEKGDISVDFIGKFENLNKDWEIIQKKLDIQSSLPHKNQNITKKKHYSEYYNKETKDIIYEKFKVDIEYFKYNFENKTLP